MTGQIQARNLRVAEMTDDEIAYEKAASFLPYRHLLSVAIRRLPDGQLELDWPKHQTEVLVTRQAFTEMVELLNERQRRIDSLEEVLLLLSAEHSQCPSPPSAHA